MQGFHLQHVDNPRLYRLLEMIPGALTWGTFIILTALSFYKPLWVISIIILYSFLWLVRVGYFITYLFISWRKFKQESRVDWMEQVKKINDWERIYHVIVIPTWNEPFEVLDHTLSSILKSSYPSDKLIVLLGGEERAGEEWSERMQQVREKYSNSFFKLMLTTHPDNIPGELKGKSANSNYIIENFRRMLDKELHIPHADIVVSNFDCDTVPHTQYFARLAYAYLIHPNPTRASYQPLALYNNNIWQSPSFTRVVANSTTFWLLTELAKPEQSTTFSSHSMSFQALVDVGYWDKTIVTEDSRIFLQCFLKYNGNYELVPMYIPINMDTVAVGNVWRTIKNQYKQMRRWAWSVEHQPYMITQFKKNKQIPFIVKMRFLWKFMEGQYSWATAPILLAIFSRLPLYVAAHQHSTSVLFQNAPFVIELILQLAMVGMIFTAYFNIKLLPAKPPEHSWTKYIVMILQWFLLPITLIIFGSLPAIDAQTRLMLGKYMGYWNTEKERKK